MPPKNQPQENTSNFKPFVVLPVTLDCEDAQECLRKPVTMKKNIDINKIIEIMKDKGLQAHLEEGKVTSAGRDFICENFKTVYDDVVGAASKPADPKKDAKKDNKKEAKKEQPAQQQEPPLEFQFQKECSEFFFLLNLPATSTQLAQIIKANIRIDIMVVIEEKIKPGSKKPDYSLLSNEKSLEDLAKTLKETIIQKNQSDQEQKQKRKKQKSQMIKQFIKMRRDQAESIKQDTLILHVSFMKDLSNPETNNDIFLNTLYRQLCECTMEKQKYLDWKSTKKVVPMIEPLKEIIKKQVQVQKEDKGKKGGKAEPITEIVEQVVETKYESLPENIKSDLSQYRKNKKIHSITRSKPSTYNDIIQDLLSVFQKKTKEKSNVNEIIQQIKQNSKKQPLNKVSSENLDENVREIVYPKELSMWNEQKFDFKVLDEEISFMQLAYQAGKNLQSLKLEYVIAKIQKMTQAAQPKIRWDFTDRQHLEHFSPQQIKAIINEELLKDPKIIGGQLPTEGLKFLVLARINPPGRVLYQNSIMDWKVLPSFQHWYQHFRASPARLQNDNFLNYECRECGNLSIQSKNMMPTDNTIIKDEIYTIGEKKTNIIQYYQSNGIFGMKQKQGKNVYWHKFNNDIEIKGFLFEKEVEHENKQNKQENMENVENEQQDRQEKKEKVQSTQIWVQYKNKYRVQFAPYPTIIWDKHPTEKKRQFGGRGEVVSYKKDGSVVIYYPNGRVSSLRNGRWTHFDEKHKTTSTTQSPVHTQQIVEGETVIKIREDQNIKVQHANNITHIIFSDGTEIHQEPSKRRRQIITPDGPLIRITLPRDVDFNVIGYGSAFAYLGFQNILERSYDGYLYEVLDGEFASHMYIEQYELNDQLVKEEVRILSFADGSQLRVLGSQGRMVYISPYGDRIPTQEYLHERWLQLFTTPDNFSEGVYDIDINSGSIATHDKQSNKFKTTVNHPSDVKIAVSFTVDPSLAIEETFPSGFHIPQQNYFLPPPNNSIPSRIFSINADGSGTEYLNRQQIGSMEGFLMEEEIRGERMVRQYTKQLNSEQKYIKLSFCEEVSVRKFGLPSRLQPKKTISNLVPVKFNKVEHRAVETLSWEPDFSRLTGLQQKIRQQISAKQERNHKLR